MDQTTLSTIPRLLSQVLANYGEAPEPLFESLGIDISAGAGSRIPMDKMAQLWQRAVDLTDNPE